MFRGLSLNRTKDKEQETGMNKMITVAILGSGLLLLEAPDAAAHEETRMSYQTRHYSGHLHHARPMPRWLKRHKAFRHWYRHTRLRRHRHLTWHRLFDIYRWESSERRKHRRAERFYRSPDHYRHHNRDPRRRHGH